MLKQQVSRVKKVLTILLAVLFLVSLTAAAVSADQDTGTPASPDSPASPSSIASPSSPASPNSPASGDSDT